MRIFKFLLALLPAIAGVAVYADDLTDTTKQPEHNANAGQEKVRVTSIGITGVGMSQTMQGIAERNSDANADRDIRAYMTMFYCKISGVGGQIKHGTTVGTPPVTSDFFNAKHEYKNLAIKLKSDKEVLGVKPGIESETITDNANTGLYDNVGVGITDGAFASVSRALTDTDGKDAQELNAQRAEAKDKIKNGVITAGAGVLVGVTGQIIGIGAGKDKGMSAINDILSEDNRNMSNSTTMPGYDGTVDSARDAERFVYEKLEEVATRIGIGIDTGGSAGEIVAGFSGQDKYRAFAQRISAPLSAIKTQSLRLSTAEEGLADAKDEALNKIQDEIKTVSQKIYESAQKLSREIDAELAHLAQEQEQLELVAQETRRRDEAIRTNQLNKQTAIVDVVIESVPGYDGAAKHARDIESQAYDKLGEFGVLVTDDGLSKETEPAAARIALESTEKYKDFAQTIPVQLNVMKTQSEYLSNAETAIKAAEIDIKNKTNAALDIAKKKLEYNSNDYTKAKDKADTGLQEAKTKLRNAQGDAISASDKMTVAAQILIKEINKGLSIVKVEQASIEALAQSVREQNKATLDNQVSEAAGSEN